jgi:MFS family permease
LAGYISGFTGHLPYISPLFSAHPLITITLAIVTILFTGAILWKIGVYLRYFVVDLINLPENWRIESDLEEQASKFNDKRRNAFNGISLKIEGILDSDTQVDNSFKVLLLGRGTGDIEDILAAASPPVRIWVEAIASGAMTQEKALTAAKKVINGFKSKHLAGGVTCEAAGLAGLDVYRKDLCVEAKEEADIRKARGATADRARFKELCVKRKDIEKQLEARKQKDIREELNSALLVQNLDILFEAMALYYQGQGALADPGQINSHNFLSYVRASERNEFDGIDWAGLAANASLNFLHYLLVKESMQAFSPYLVKHFYSGQMLPYLALKQVRPGNPFWLIYRLIRAKAGKSNPDCVTKNLVNTIASCEAGGLGETGSCKSRAEANLELIKTLGISYKTINSLRLNEVRIRDLMRTGKAYLPNPNQNTLFERHMSQDMVDVINERLELEERIIDQVRNFIKAHSFDTLDPGQRQAVEFLFRPYTERMAAQLWRNTIAKEELRKKENENRSWTSVLVFIAAFVALAVVCAAIVFLGKIWLFGFIAAAWAKAAAIFEWYKGLAWAWKVLLAPVYLLIALPIFVSFKAVVQAAGRFGQQKLGFGDWAHKFSLFKFTDSALLPWGLQMSINWFFKTAVLTICLSLVVCAVSLAYCGSWLLPLASPWGIAAVAACAFFFSPVFNQRTKKEERVEDAYLLANIEDTFCSLIVSGEADYMSSSVYLLDFLARELKRGEILEDVVRFLNKQCEILDFVLFAKKIAETEAYDRSNDAFKDFKNYRGNDFDSEKIKHLLLSVRGGKKEKEFAQLHLSDLTPEARRNLHRILFSKDNLSLFVQERFNSYWQELSRDKPHPYRGLNFTRHSVNNIINGFINHSYRQIIRKPHYSMNLWSYFQANLALLLGGSLTALTYMSAHVWQDIPAAGVFSRFIHMAHQAPDLWMVPLAITWLVFTIGAILKFSQLSRAWAGGRRWYAALFAAIAALAVAPFAYTVDFLGFLSPGTDPKSDSVWRTKLWHRLILVAYVASGIFTVTAIAPYFINVLFENQILGNGVSNYLFPIFIGGAFISAFLPFVFRALYARTRKDAAKKEIEHWKKELKEAEIRSSDPNIAERQQAENKKNQCNEEIKRLKSEAFRSGRNSTGWILLSAVVLVPVAFISKPIAMFATALWFIVNNSLFLSYASMELIEGFMALMRPRGTVKVPLRPLYYRGPRASHIYFTMDEVP